MTTRFWKYHGLGNDFLLVDRRGSGDIPSERVRATCDRNFGIGADGIAALFEVEGRPFMRVFNSDGSTADMCGNALRCFVMWLVEEQGYAPDALVVGSDAGDQSCVPVLESGRVVAVRVDLGPPKVAGPARVEVDGVSFEGHDLFLGNPHFVIPSAPAAPDVPARYGPGLSTHPRFPRGTNVEWLEVLGPAEARVVVYERGCGLTRACGTGGAGAAAVGALLGGLARGADIRLHQPGGGLIYRVDPDDDHVWMTGPAERVFVGETELF